ncbi:type IV pilus modification PilV family protein [Metabacillus malikii]|uniref:Prepilin-type N-terminal cleavage/methylation domain-containing protein n=1 Tax=Metabacillus malikii TaxID=1504265 RepID=A0ABT9ZKI3_9BACI|nr:prepilin-type N-terminal cleavage/methylation domain-containing protein [Metabacillus malikii]MDQ0232811.1 prepilin-type N-terminal cleavage/methylation domain-containing protein [Metabacillus malikii]
MKRKMNMMLISERGLTLIEIVAALVILSIIVISFMSFFIQSSRTNTNSGKIIDATYVAQAEIEEIINSEEHLKQYKNVSCQKAEADKKCYEANKNGYLLQIERKIKNNQTHVIIKVFNENHTNKLEAQMETILPRTKAAGGG